MEVPRDESFESLIKLGLKQYSGLMRSKCRKWENEKLSADDLFSECLIVLMRVTQYHSHLGIESREFKNLLLDSVKNRIVDLLRSFSTKRRNRFLEVEYDPNWDDNHVAELWSSSPTRPDDIAEVIQLVQKLEEKLDDIDKKMLAQILYPPDELLKISREHEKATLARSNRRSNGARTEICVHVLGQGIGLSYKQALRSLDRIRCTMRVLLNES